MPVVQLKPVLSSLSDLLVTQSQRNGLLESTGRQQLAVGSTRPLNPPGLFLSFCVSSLTTQAFGYSCIDPNGGTCPPSYCEDVGSDGKHPHASLISHRESSGTNHLAFWGNVMFRVERPYTLVHILTSTDRRCLCGTCQGKTSCRPVAVNCDVYPYAQGQGHHFCRRGVRCTLHATCRARYFFGA